MFNTLRDVGTLKIAMVLPAFDASAQVCAEESEERERASPLDSRRGFVWGAGEIDISDDDVTVARESS